MIGVKRSRFALGGLHLDVKIVTDSISLRQQNRGGVKRVYEMRDLHLVNNFLRKIL